MNNENTRTMKTKYGTVDRNICAYKQLLTDASGWNLEHRTPVQLERRQKKNGKEKMNDNASTTTKTKVWSTKRKLSATYTNENTRTYGPVGDTEESDF